VLFQQRAQAGRGLEVMGQQPGLCRALDLRRRIVDEQAFPRGLLRLIEEPQEHLWVGLAGAEFIRKVCTFAEDRRNF